MLGLVLVPFGLPTLQVLGVLGERRQLALERGALEQLLAPFELTPQLLLRLGEALQGLSGRLRIEPRERFLQLAQPLLELGRQRPLQQLLHLTQAVLERAATSRPDRARFPRRAASIGTTSRRSAESPPGRQAVRPGDRPDPGSAPGRDRASGRSARVAPPTPNQPRSRRHAPPPGPRRATLPYWVTATRSRRCARCAAWVRCPTLRHRVAACRRAGDRGARHRAVPARSLDPPLRSRPATPAPPRRPGPCGSHASSRRKPW